VWPAIVFLFVPVVSRANSYVVFRYDDFAGDRPGIRSTNEQRQQLWQAEQEIDEHFARRRMSYVVAIIPYPRSCDRISVGPLGEKVSFGEDAEKVEFIRRAVQAGRIEVAQHGLSHINKVHEVNPKHRHGEFRERDYDSQLGDIEQGRKILTETCQLANIETFVPPWNGWDRNTAEALKKAGFGVLSANRNYYSKSVTGLKVIPSTASLFELEKMVEQGNLPDDGIIVVLYHPWDIAAIGGTEHCFGTERFGKLLRNLSLAEDVEVVTFAQLVRKLPDLTTVRYRRAVSVRALQDFWSSLLPKHLLHMGENHLVYLRAEEYGAVLLRWQILTAILIVGLLLLGALSRFLLGPSLSKKGRLLLNVLAVAVFCLFVLSEFHLLYKGYAAKATRAIPACIAAGFLISSGLSKVRKRMRRTAEDSGTC